MNTSSSKRLAIANAKRLLTSNSLQLKRKEDEVQSPLSIDHYNLLLVNKLAKAALAEMNAAAALDLAPQNIQSVEQLTIPLGRAPSLGQRTRRCTYEVAS